EFVAAPRLEKASRSSTHGKYNRGSMRTTGANTVRAYPSRWAPHDLKRAGFARFLAEPYPAMCILHPLPNRIMNFSFRALGLCHGWSTLGGLDFRAVRVPVEIPQAGKLRFEF